jgi:hypothetical protein
MQTAYDKNNQERKSRNVIHNKFLSQIMPNVTQVNNARFYKRLTSTQSNIDLNFEKNLNIDLKSTTVDDQSKILNLKSIEKH